MSARRRWREVPLDQVVEAGGWRHDDPVAMLKLEASLRRYGQLRALVVRQADGGLEVVDGRRLLRALRAVGATSAWVVDLGKVEDGDTLRAALALEIGFETDYARLAMAVAGMLEAGATPDEVASGGPFTAERVRYFGVLARFDWSQFAPVADGQSAMDWDAPAAAAHAEPGAHALAPVPDEEATEAVVEAVVEEAVLACHGMAVDEGGQATLF